jgi:hypothetical protein
MAASNEKAAVIKDQRWGKKRILEAGDKSVRPTIYHDIISAYEFPATVLSFPGRK